MLLVRTPLLHECPSGRMVLSHLAVWPQGPRHCISVSSCKGVSQAQKSGGLFSTHVEYGRYAALLAVKLILGSLGSHGRSPTAMILSSTGGLSTR
jgi:hypothetical protein